MLEELFEALKGTGFRFAHHGWSTAPDGDYGTYSEEAGDDFVADGIHGERGTRGYINLYTRDDSIAPRETIEEVLNGLNIPWYLNTVQFENDTGYVHYEWGFSTYG